MTDNIVIKRMHTDDIEVLREISILTFKQTYAEYNTDEDMHLHISEKFNHDKLLQELKNEHNYFFIMMLNEIPSGYIKLRTTEQPEALKNRKHIELERIYVLKAFQGYGLGYLLIGQAIKISKEKGYEVLWLGVWKQNIKAFNFYTKYGFEVFGEQIFKLGTDEQIDWLMKKELQD